MAIKLHLVDEYGGKFVTRIGFGKEGNKSGVIPNKKFPNVMNNMLAAYIFFNYKKRADLQTADQPTKN